MMLARRAAFEMHPLPQPLSREGRGELHIQSRRDSAKFSGQRSKSPSPLAGEGGSYTPKACKTLPKPKASAVKPLSPSGRGVGERGMQ